MMITRSFFAAVCLASLALAQPPLTTIQDVLYKADGTRFNGTLTISWTSFEAVDTSAITTQTTTVTVVAGNLRVQLVPTTTAAPAASYTVKYNSDGRITFSETWAVPSSVQPLRVRDVRIASTQAGLASADAVVTPVQESDVFGLVPDLGARPLKGPGYAAGRVALVNPAGSLESVTGSPSDCVRVDGSSGPCGGGAQPSFVDGDSPTGIVDGSNTTFTLSAVPNPSSSLALYRNGMLQKAAQDFTANGNAIQFVAAAAPQPGDTLLASYRLTGTDTGSPPQYLVSPQQINPAGLTAGQAWLWNGSSYVAGDVGNGGVASTGSYSNPAWIASLAFAKITGVPSFALTVSPVFTGQPTIPDFTLAPHSHLNAAGGGTLDAAAIGSGSFGIGQIPTGTSSSTVALGNHTHAGVYEPVIASGSTAQYLRGDKSLGTFATDALAATAAALALKAPLASPAFTGTVTVGTTVLSPTLGVNPAGRPIVTASAHHAYGDSFTVGTGATILANAYITKLANAENAVLTNRAVSGSQACETAQLVFANENPSDSHAPISSVMIGVNDANIKGTGAYEPVFNACHQAMLSWLAISSSYKVFGQNASCVPTGTWAADNATYLSGVAVKSTTNASTLACAIQTTGGPLYAWYNISDTSGGVFTYSLDGGTATPVNAFTTPAIAAQNGGTAGVALIRVSGVAAGSHTLTFAVTSATNAGNVVEILGVGTTPAVPRYGQPRVFVGGVTKQQADVKSAITAQYDADVATNAATLSGDGLPVYFVNVRAYVASTAAEMFDGLHPNDVGHGHLRDAFEAVEQIVPNTGAPLQVAASLPSDLNGYSNVNANALLSTTALTPGLVVYNNGTSSAFGMDLGYDTGYYLRLFTSSTFATKVCTYPAGALPTLQSAFTCYFSVSPSGTATVGTHTATTFTDATLKGAMGSVGFLLGSAGKLAWAAGTAWSGTNDTGLSRSAAGVVAVGNGTAGDISGKVAQAGGSINKSVCWKTSTTMGFCSSVVAADGSCTCN
jgi:hypothetical protein